MTTGITGYRDQTQAGETRRSGGGALPYVCPKCFAHLAERAGVFACPECAASYPVLADGYPDFAGSESTFDDWWMESPEKMHRWLTEEAPKEEEFQAGVARRYVLPLLGKLGYPPGNASVLSAACGLGADVDALNDAGYSTWGIDCGNRAKRWSQRHSLQRLARADALHLPFADGFFDFVMGIDLLEHVGVVGDTTMVAPDYESQRLKALESLLRVTKPGGYLLLSSLNRRFPIDFGHVQNGGIVRFHSPWERFLLSYGDVKRLCRATGQVDWTRPLPLRGFFSWTNLRHKRTVRPLLPFVDWTLGSLPAWVYGSWLSLFWIVLVYRCADGASSPRDIPAR